MLKPDKEFKSRKIANWAVEMSEHDLIVAKRAGRVHFTTDFISRLFLSLTVIVSVLISCSHIVESEGRRQRGTF